MTPIKIWKKFFFQVKAEICAVVKKNWWKPLIDKFKDLPPNVPLLKLKFIFKEVGGGGLHPTSILL
jgi:hypothetical protein